MSPPFSSDCYNVHPNPEVQAQLLISQIASEGNLNSLDSFMKNQLSPGLVQHILDALKQKGNEAFQKGLGFH